MHAPGILALLATSIATVTLAQVRQTEMTRQIYSESFDVPWHTIDVGGAIGVSDGAPGGFTLSGTIAQHDASTVMTGGGFELSGGFWFEGAAECQEDVSGDGVVDVIDFLLTLAAWGPCLACPEDINEDGVVNILDFLLLLAGWGSCD